jgi:Fur family ferric uptake transcriptional regulator
VCRDRGRTEDVDGAVGLAPCLDPSDSQGFELDEAEVVFWGRCPDCLRAQVSQPPTG